MSIGWTPGGPVTPGGAPFGIGEPFAGDPRVAPGFPRPIGWEVRAPDGSAAYLKTGLADTAWLSFADLGGGPGTTPTLAQVYAAGLAPLTDDVMVMPSGNLRFPGAAAGPFNYPGYAYLENAPPAAQGDPRIGTNYHGRYYSTGVGVGGFAVDEITAFDPVWNGSFPGIAGLQVTHPSIGFNHHLDQGDANVEMKIGQMRWAQVGGFFDGPQAYPTPGFNSGQREDLWIDLWNGFGSGFFNHPAMDLSGWGQPTFNTISTATGVITAGINLSWWWGPSPVAGDGLGIFFTLGTDDPPKGLISNTVLTSDIHGLYRLGFYTASATNVLDGPILTLDWENGAVFQVPATFAGGNPGVVAYGSTAIDLTAVSSGTQIVPARPGKTFIPVRLQFYQLTTAGVMTTPASVQVNNGATVLLPSTNAFTNSTAFGFGIGGLTQGAPTQGTMQVSTATTLDVTVAATGTGGFAYEIITIVTGFYV